MCLDSGDIALLYNLFAVDILSLLIIDQEHQILIIQLDSDKDYPDILTDRKDAGCRQSLACPPLTESANLTVVVPLLLCRERLLFQ
jgi:hypothetical protein